MPQIFEEEYNCYSFAFQVGGAGGGRAFGVLWREGGREAVVGGD